MENCPRGVCGASPSPSRIRCAWRTARAGLRGEEGLVLLVLPLASGRCPPVVWGAVRRWRAWPRVGRGLFCYSFWDAARRWRVWPRVGRGLFCYSFWDAASTSAI